VNKGSELAKTADSGMASYVNIIFIRVCGGEDKVVPVHSCACHGGLYVGGVIVPRNVNLHTGWR
jgi:hypothetical protein